MSDREPPVRIDWQGREDAGEMVIDGGRGVLFEYQFTSETILDARFDRPWSKPVGVSEEACRMLFGGHHWRRLGSTKKVAGTTERRRCGLCEKTQSRPSEAKWSDV